MVQLDTEKGCTPVVMRRMHLAIRGAVQGVGFRPFVYRLACELHLAGWVANSPLGVTVEVEGEEAVLQRFLLRVESERPPHSFIQSLEFRFLDPVPFAIFEIRESEIAGDRQTIVLPDIATCRECLREVFNPQDRRYRYPFANCTHCGPRFTIIESLPYDRPGTSMCGFTLCADCRREYFDPCDRRFHAQPIACPACGPQLELWDESGGILAIRDVALRAAAAEIRAGRIVAVKGLGGFHLLVDARNEPAVRRLRERKHREEKPFALLYPSVEAILASCHVSPLENRLLVSPESPIVLLRRRQGPAAARDAIAPVVAPRNPYLGVMLPSTPLHHLLMGELDFPVVATSGNLSDEPICTDEREALVRLQGIAEFFLVHNRPILRHMDDSIVRVLLGRELVLRRARGYAPLPLPLPRFASGILAVGGHLKNTVALTVGNQAFLSQHIGDLDNREAVEAFEKVIQSLEALYGIHPARIAADLHPDYGSSRFANRTAQKVTTVQHHFAHVAACMAENELRGSALGVAWDGTGLGLDGSIWGGEFFLADESCFQRVASFRQFRLPGGEQAIQEPRRAALGLLCEIFGDAAFEFDFLAPIQAFSRSETTLLRQMLKQGLNSPLTSSAGRLFDAVAALAGLRQRSSFEGQAAMELEFALEESTSEECYPFSLSDVPSQVGRCEKELDSPVSFASDGARGMPTDESGSQTGEKLNRRNFQPAGVHLPLAISSDSQRLSRVEERDAEPVSQLRSPDETATALNSQTLIRVDWEPAFRAILADLESSENAASISRTFHNTLAEMIVAVATRIQEPKVVLSGGCFQNRYLAERTIRRLEVEGFCPYWHQRVPPNDGGIALGQAAVVAALQAGGCEPVASTKRRPD